VLYAAFVTKGQNWNLPQHVAKAVYKQTLMLFCAAANAFHRETNKVNTDINPKSILIISNVSLDKNWENNGEFQASIYTHNLSIY
jgi:hypothetical protein